MYNIKEDVRKILIHSQSYPFDLENVDVLIDQWSKAKNEFLELFKGKTFIRSKNKVTTELTKEERRDEFNDFISFLSDNGLMTKELNDFLLLNQDGFFSNRVICPCPSKKISLGSKLSKSLKNFIEEEMDVRWAQDEISKIIQKNKVEGYLYLSVDPRDFLTLSDSNNNWWSCHSLDGDYRAGNLNYMVDSTTIVAYLASDEKENFRGLPLDVKWYSKRWRMLIHTDINNCIYYNKQYPFASNGLLEEVHAMLTKFLSTRFTHITDDGFRTIKNKSNIQIVETNQIYVAGRIFDTRDFIDISDYIGYSDLIHSGSYTPRISLNEEKYFKLLERSSSRDKMISMFHDLYNIKIGEKVLCPKCGKGVLDLEGNFLCQDCRRKYNASENFYTACCDCGHKIYEEEETFWIEGSPYCKYCYKEFKEEE